MLFSMASCRGSFCSLTTLPLTNAPIVHLVFGLLLFCSELAGADEFEPMLQFLSFKRGARRSRTVKLVSVLNYGAKGNGFEDDTEAFLEAWKQACSSKVGAILEIPAGNAYFLRPINFRGPCKSKVTMLIMGTIIAPSDPYIWHHQNPRKWLYFHGLKDFELKGEGIVDGMGQNWWAKSCKSNTSNPCQHSPTAITFHRMRRLTVKDLTIVNSQKMHLAFTYCTQVQVSRVKVIAPERSPNTDGIHISSSVYVAVEDSIIGTGDDCISIVGNSSYIILRNTVCGPGHGISIGSLGKNKSNDRLHNVLVDEAFISNTENGVRIKTWQGGEGYARSIVFRNIVMRNVSNPITIDQYYCDSSNPCQNQTSAVKVGGIAFTNVKGTSATRHAMKFACSDSSPCEKIYLKDIELYRYSGGNANAACWKASGFSVGVMQPPSCLSNNHPVIKQNIISYHFLHSSA